MKKKEIEKEEVSRKNETPKDSKSSEKKIETPKESVKKTSKPSYSEEFLNETESFIVRESFNKHQLVVFINEKFNGAVIEVNQANPYQIAFTINEKIKMPKDGFFSIK